MQKPKVSMSLSRSATRHDIIGMKLPKVRLAQPRPDITFSGRRAGIQLLLSEEISNAASDENRDVFQEREHEAYNRPV